MAQLTEQERTELEQYARDKELLKLKKEYEKKYKKKGHPIIKGFFIVIAWIVALCIISIVLFAAFSDREHITSSTTTADNVATSIEEEKPNVDMVASARGACMFAIKQMLPDATGLKFDTRYAEALEIKPKIWRVRMDVRGKNAYGVTFINQFTCTLQDNGDNWVTLKVK